MRFTYAKASTPPVIPSPVSAGAFQFLGGSIMFNNPNPTMSLETYNWAVTGVYLYVEDCRSSPDDGFILGSHPYLTIPQQSNANTFSASAPPIGAIAQAGDDVKRGYNQGQLISSEGNWLYNNASYYPYTLLNEELANGTTTYPINPPDPPTNVQQYVDTGFFFGVTDTDPFKDNPTEIGDNLPPLTEDDPVIDV